jgi:hypothetical protein
MARFGTKVESQVAQLSGLPVTTTFNGYFAAIVAGTAQGFKLRRLKIGVRAGATVPTSQQMSIAAFRQTVRTAGTGFSTVVGQNFDPNGAASQASGVDITTAATAGTNGPTLAAVALDEWSFNTQAGLDLPWEMLEELMCALGTANGIALVNIGNALPAAHLFTVGTEWEE